MEAYKINEGLFDKNLFPERRQELLSTIITPKMSQFKTIADKASTGRGYDFI